MKRVLIVDDAAFIRKILRSILEKNHYRVVGEAENGKIGLEKYIARKPDLVLLDIVMPVMDGVECLKEMKKINPDVKVIICSTVEDAKVVQELYHLGIVDFITKPVKEERLLKTIYRLFSDGDDDDDEDAYKKRDKFDIDFDFDD